VSEIAPDDEPDLLGVFELAVRGANEIVDDLREALARHIDQRDALLELRNTALEVATRGQGRDVTADDLFATVDGEELARARLAALFSRATELPIPNPTT
jgi:hypothetical protein